jgi:hypothetical protein
MHKLDGIEFSAKKERADTVTERKGEREALARVGNGPAIGILSAMAGADA